MSFPPLSELLPHRGRMIWLDEVVASREGGTVCRATVREACPAVHGGLLEPAALLEHMAQAVAADAGLEHRSSGVPVRPGVVMSCRELLLEADPLPIGTELEVEARRELGDASLARYLCEVRVAGRRVARATLSVYQGDLAHLAQP